MNETATMIKAAELVPLLDSVIGFVSDAVNARDAAQAKVAQLTAQPADKEKSILEKVAATPMFNPAEVRNTLTALANPQPANWTLAHFAHPLVRYGPTLTTADRLVRIAHVAELADALDSGSSE